MQELHACYRACTFGCQHGISIRSTTNEFKEIKLIVVTFLSTYDQIIKFIIIELITYISNHLAGSNLNRNLYF